MSNSTTKNSSKHETKTAPQTLDPQAQLREIQQLLFGQFKTNKRLDQVIGA